MDKKELRDGTVNHIVAVGRLIWIGRSLRGYPAIRLAVRGRNNVTAYVNFTLGEHTVLDNSIRLRDYLKLEGYVRAFFFHDESRGGRSGFYQEFVAETIGKEPSELDSYFSVEGKYVATQVFCGHFKGTVSNAIVVTRTKEGAPIWGKLAVRVSMPGRDMRPSYIVLGYRIGPGLPPFDFMKGDEVCLFSSISTRDKVFDGVTHHFENLNVEDIKLLKRADDSPGSESAEAEDGDAPGMRFGSMGFVDDKSFEP